MIYISIGSNLGNRLINIQQALAKIKATGFSILKQSPIIETEALLPDSAPAEWNKPFFNMIIAGVSQASPVELLHQLQAIENDLGRERPHPKWAPRIMDLDVLLIDEKCSADQHFIVPHCELLQRPFFLHLLAMIAPDVQHPLVKKTFAEIVYQQTKPYSANYSLVAAPQFIGVVNVTPDSFSDGGKFFNTEQAIEQVLQLHHAGASLIELGAQSTRPGAILVSADTEYARLAPVLEGLAPAIKEHGLQLCIDSFNGATLKKIFQQYPIACVNDQTGNLDLDTLAHIASKNCQLIVMHSLTIPTQQDNIVPFERSVVNTVLIWAEKKLRELRQIGFSDEQIIVDPGVGFNKTAYQNLALLKDIAQLKSLGVKICVGHSRKSFLSLFNRLSAAERDIESLAVAKHLANYDIDYLRVHDVAAQQRYFSVNTILDQTHSILLNQGETHEISN